MGVVRFSYKNSHALVSVSDQPYTVRYDDINKTVLFIRNRDETILATNVIQADEGKNIIDEFIEAYTKEEKKVISHSSMTETGNEKGRSYSNWIIAILCIAVVVFYTYGSFNKSGSNFNLVAPQISHDITSSGNTGEEINEFQVSGEGIQTILNANITESEIKDISEGKKLLFAVLEKAKNMDDIERKKYLNSQEVKELLNKKWARDFLE